jgi:hypothetical protein
MNVIATTKKTGFVMARIERIMGRGAPGYGVGKGPKSKNANTKTQATGPESD